MAQNQESLPERSKDCKQAKTFGTEQAAGRTLDPTEGIRFAS
jgi:hypothetical protein